MCGTLTTLLNQAASSQEWPAAHHSRQSAICCAPSCPPALQTTPSQGRRYRLDTIDLNWEDLHNLLPHSESIIYLSPSNLECQSIHSNLHRKIVWSKLGYQHSGVQNLQTGKGLHIYLLKTHGVSAVWLKSCPLKLRCPWLVFGAFNVWHMVYMHTKPPITEFWYLINISLK